MTLKNLRGNNATSMLDVATSFKRIGNCRLRSTNNTASTESDDDNSTIVSFASLPRCTPFHEISDLTTSTNNALHPREKGHDFQNEVEMLRYLVSSLETQAKKNTEELRYYTAHTSCLEQEKKELLRETQQYFDLMNSHEKVVKVCEEQKKIICDLTELNEGLTRKVQKISQDTELQRRVCKKQERTIAHLTEQVQRYKCTSQSCATSHNVDSQKVKRNSHPLLKSSVVNLLRSRDLFKNASPTQREENLQLENFVGSGNCQEYQKQQNHPSTSENSTNCLMAIKNNASCHTELESNSFIHSCEEPVRPERLTSFISKRLLFFRQFHEEGSTMHNEIESNCEEVDLK